jgi:acetyltransferase-like isoleucine patch superfamily enzyme
VVGAAAVVTKDVPDYGVVVDSPAKVIKMLDPEKFPKDPDH